MTDVLIKRKFKHKGTPGMFTHTGKTMRGHSEKVAIYKLRREASREIKTADTLILNI